MIGYNNAAVIASQSGGVPSWIDGLKDTASTAFGFATEALLRRQFPEQFVEVDNTSGSQGSPVDTAVAESTNNAQDQKTQMNTTYLLYGSVALLAVASIALIIQRR